MMIYACLMVRWRVVFLAEPSSKLFANSLSRALVPTDWHWARIWPMHKKGDPEDSVIYRCRVAKM